MPPRTINKSAFVRSFPNLSAAEIVAKAKQRGFTISTAHVYTIRSSENRKKGLAGSGGGGARPAKGRASGNLHAMIDRMAKSFVEQILATVGSGSAKDLVGG